MGLRITAMTAAAVLWAPLVSAQDSERAIPRPILRMVDSLDSDDLSAREDATAALTQEVLRPSQFNAGMIQRLLRQPDLSPEQRARLILVDRATFASTPRAAMGIRFAQTTDQGVGIGATFPDFPSFEVLQAGDVILAIDGEPLLSQDDLRMGILSRDPGDVLHLTIRRGEDEIELDVPLGFYTNLNQQLQQQTIEMALARRMRRLSHIGAESTPVIDARRDAEGGSPRRPEKTVWLGGEQNWDDRGLATITPGGAERVAPDPDGAQAEALAAAQIRANAINPVLLDRNVINLAERQEGALRAQLQEYLDRLGKPGLTVGEQRALKQQVMRLRSQIEMFESIRRIERERKAP